MGKRSKTKPCFLFRLLTYLRPQKVPCTCTFEHILQYTVSFSCTLDSLLKYKALSYSVYRCCTRNSPVWIWRPGASWTQANMVFSSKNFRFFIFDASFPFSFFLWNICFVSISLLESNASIILGVAGLLSLHECITSFLPFLTLS